MVQMSIGDLSSTFWNQVHNRRVKSTLQDLSTQLATGKTTDLHAATGGDFRNLTSIESTLSSLNAYKISTSETSIFAETMQRSLTSIQETVSEVGAALLIAGSSDSPSIIQTTTTDARSRFEMVVSVLNTQIGNRGLFSGTGTSGIALISSEEILDELKTAIASETTAIGVDSVVSAWFDDVGGGFETTAYLGSDDDLAPFRIGPNENAEIKLRADSQGMRDVLKSFALASLVSEGALFGDSSERNELTRISADQFLNNETTLTEFRAQVGTVEAQIETAQARNSAETSALEIARSDIVAIDPYESATDLQNTQTQLEMLYTMTARLSRLSLVNYI